MVINRHERILNATPETIGALLDKLASSDDLLWAHNRGWSPMKFDRPLQVGAVGGHGPIGYRIEQYIPNQKIMFRFTAPKGFIGTHGLYLKPINANQTRLSHVLEAKLEGSMWFSWTFLFRPMHDALVEDTLDNAQLLFEPNIKRKTWSLYVKFLRLMIRTIKQVSSKTKADQVKAELK